MPRKKKIIAALAALLFLAASAGLLRVVKPLVSASGFDIIYTKGEDFRSDGKMHTRLFRRSPHYLFVPGVDGVSRWWVIDFENMKVYEAKPPRRFLLVRFVLRDDPRGVALDAPAMNKEWRWQFTTEGVSFTGENFTCIIRRATGGKS